jgi:PqqD family protein of HPr-rel-A system
MQFIYRRLGDGGVVFSVASWETHLLTPSAAVIFEVLLEHADSGPLEMSCAEEVLSADLGLNGATPEIRKVLGMLQEIGLIRP